MRNKVVGYVPYDFDLSHPGDRRRLAFWANRRGFQLNFTKPFESDLIVLSNAANFSKYLKESRVPVVLDLVDSYLSETPSFFRDVLRNIIRSLNGSSSLKWITYTNHLKYACAKADAIIVASNEQLQVLRPFNQNIYVISDSHSEFEFNRKCKELIQGNFSESAPLNVMWEGFGSNLRNFQFMSQQLDSLIYDGVIQLRFVTEMHFYRWGGYIWRVSTKRTIKKLFPKSHQLIEIIPWTIENLKYISRKSDLAIIPIDQNDLFARMKPENKLLSMWKLGLPTIFSDTPSYRRTAEAARCEMALVRADQWKCQLMRMAEYRDELLNLRTLGINYVKSFHSETALLSKWDDAINETLSKSLNHSKNSN